MLKKVSFLILFIFFSINFSYALNDTCLSNCSTYLTINQTQAPLNFSNIFIMFTLISLFLGVYIKLDNPANILIKIISWFFFFICSWLTLVYVLEVGGIGTQTVFILMGLYSLILLVLIIYTILRYYDNILTMFKKSGF